MNGAEVSGRVQELQTRLNQVQGEGGEREGGRE